MKIVTNIAIPHEVYRFYMKIAQQFENCTPEDIIVDALTQYAGQLSEEILKNHPECKGSGNDNCGRM